MIRPVIRRWLWYALWYWPAELAIDEGGNARFTAEGLGFEPRWAVKPKRFSRPPHSTALPPLRGNKYGLMIAIEEPKHEALMPILDAHSKISPLNLRSM